MCGRYALYGPFQHDDPLWVEGWVEHISNPLLGVARYNIAPSQTLPVVVLESSRPVVRSMRWGLIPHWARDRKIGYSTINARVEGLAGKPTFRHAWKQGQRCLVPASGWYEWKPDGAAKQPYYLHPTEGDNPIMLAGLWERWHAPDGEPLDSYTILTCAAQADLSAIHPRQPRVLPIADWRAWLEADVPAAAAWLSPAIAAITATRVSRAVNAPRHDAPELIASV